MRDNVISCIYIMAYLLQGMNLSLSITHFIGSLPWQNLDSIDEVIAEKMKIENFESVFSGDYSFLYDMLNDFNLHSTQPVDLSPIISKLRSMVSEKHITFGVRLSFIHSFFLSWFSSLDKTKSLC